MDDMPPALPVLRSRRNYDVYSLDENNKIIRLPESKYAELGRYEIVMKFDNTYYIYKQNIGHRIIGSPIENYELVKEINYGEYRNKYLKYKNKYLRLKQLLKL